MRYNLIRANMPHLERVLCASTCQPKKKQKRIQIQQSAVSCCRSCCCCFAFAFAFASAGDSCLSQFVNHQIALNALFRSTSMLHGPLAIAREKSLIVIVFFAKRKRLGTPRKRHSLHGSLRASFATLLYSIPLFLFLFPAFAPRSECTGMRAFIDICTDIYINMVYMYMYYYKGIGCNRWRFFFISRLGYSYWFVCLLAMLCAWERDIEWRPGGAHSGHREQEQTASKAMPHASYANAIQLSILNGGLSPTPTGILWPHSSTSVRAVHSSEAWNDRWPGPKTKPWPMSLAQGEKPLPLCLPLPLSQLPPSTH